MTEADRPRLTAALLAWYRRQARDLPWRRTADPYRIWVSEVMLQQTQVDTVRTYYERFLTRFPTVTDLAGASLEEVLQVWQGLGYYRRARSLHAAARQVVEAHGGELPTDAEALRRLPGFGPYTVAAVASLAFGLPLATVDGNVERVVTRLDAIHGDPRRGEAKRRVQELATTLLPPGAPGELNQALMELGATVCGPARPRCGACPVAQWCAARQAGEPTRFPEREPRPTPRDRVHACAVLRSDAGLLLARRKPEGRWGGLWELPRVELDPADDPRDALRAGLAASLGCDVEVGERLAELRHGVSGERIRLEAYACGVTDGEPSPGPYAELRWVGTPHGLPLPAPQRRLLTKLRQPPLPGT